VRQVLTDALVRTLKAPATGRTELADLRCTGLTFRVTEKGARSWSFRFRDPQSRMLTRATIGTYPDVSLADARKAADKMRRTVASGTNPVTIKRTEKQEATTKTFQYLADRYMAEHSIRRKRSHRADARNLRLHVLPKWAARRYDAIKRADVIELLEDLVKGGKPSLANSVQSLISSIFTFAIDAALVGEHPCIRLKKRGVEKIGRRVLTDDEIRLLWPRLVEAPLPRRIGLALRLMLLTAARPGEVAGLSRGELQDLERADRGAWVLPEARSKNKRAHLIPLGKMARETVGEILTLTDEAEPFLFPSPSKQGRPITAQALASAMGRFTASLEADGARTWKAEPPTPHDLRRTVATRLSSLGVSRQDRDAVLNHAPTDVGGKHYDLYEREREKRRALNLWDTALGAILTPSKKVIPIANATDRAGHNRTAG
jgi:integrase